LWIGVGFIMLVASWLMKTLTPPNLLSKNLQQTATEQQIIAPIALPKVSVPDKVEVEKSVSPEQTIGPAPVLIPVLPKMPAEEKPSLAITPEEPAAVVSNPLKAKNTGESSEIVITKPTAQKPSALPPKIKVAEPVAKPEVPVVVSPPALSPPVVPPIKKTPDLKVETAAGADENVDWIMAQPAENYTLQVMVLSTKAAAQRFLKKYPAYSDRLKCFVINKSALQKFVLIYGSFASSAEAKNSKAELPAEFKYSLEKRFKLIQNESRR
jgi:DamX protein